MGERKVNVCPVVWGGGVSREWKKEKKSLKSIYQFDTATVARGRVCHYTLATKLFLHPFIHKHTHTNTYLSTAIWSLLKQQQRAITMLRERQKI